MQRASLLGALVKKAPDMPNQGQCTGITWIKRDGSLRQLARAPCRANRILCPGLAHQEQVPIGPPCMRRGIARLQGRGRGQQLSGGMKSARLNPVNRGNGTQCQVECGEISQITGDAALAFTEQEFGVDLRSNLRGDLLLKHQHIVHLPIESMGPDHVTAGTDIEETNDDANASPRALQRAVEKVVGGMLMLRVNETRYPAES